MMKKIIKNILVGLFAFVAFFATTNKPNVVKASIGGSFNVESYYVVGESNQGSITLGQGAVLSDIYFEEYDSLSYSVSGAVLTISGVEEGNPFSYTYEAVASTGFVFVSWGFSGDVGNDGNIMDEDVSFFANFEKGKYTVTYEANIDSYTGTLPVDETEYESGQTVTVSSSTLNSFGYFFKGWALSATATEGISSFIKSGEDEVLYGVWESKISEQPSYSNDFEVTVNPSIEGTITYKWVCYGAEVGCTDRKLTLDDDEIEDIPYVCDVYLDGTRIASSDIVYPTEIRFEKKDENLNPCYGTIDTIIICQFAGRNFTVPNANLIQLGKKFVSWIDSDGNNYIPNTTATTPLNGVALRAVLEETPTHTCNGYTFDTYLLGDSELPGGYYYLKEDTVLNCNVSFDKTFGGSSYSYICLNGHVLDLNGYQIYAQSVNLYIMDCHHSDVTNYYSIDSDGKYINENNNPSKNSPSIKTIKGGVICNADDCAVNVASGHETNIFSVNFVSNFSTSESKGGALSLFGNGNIYDSYFANNKAAKKGGAIYLGSKNLLLSDCTFENNSANQGGAIFASTLSSNVKSSLTLLNTKINNNSATTQGGGILYDSGSDCLVEGTSILMGNGTNKNIEDIKAGDVVKTFNHFTGLLENQEVFYIYESAVEKEYFTLHFESGNTISFVGLHDLFEKESSQYVQIKSEDATNFIGKHFYNALTNSFDKLVNVTYSKYGSKYYSIYTDYNSNCIANNMLTMNDDADYMYNIFKYNNDLTINQEQLDKDIALYGLFDYEDCSFMPYEDYLTLQVKYLNIAIGKGLITYKEALGHYYEAHDEETTKDNTKAKQSKLAKFLSKLFKSSTLDTYNTYVDSTLGNGYYVYIGTGTNITSNKHGDVDNNLVLSANTKVYVINGASNFSAGITMNTAASTGVLANSGNFGYSMPNKTYATNNFSSDIDTLKIRVEKDEGKETYTYSINGSTLTYDDNVANEEIDIPVDELYYANGDQATISSFSPARSNYFFKGWNTQADGKGTTYEGGNKLTFAGDDVTLYAMWQQIITAQPCKANDYTVTVNPDIEGTITYNWKYGDTGYGTVGCYIDKLKEIDFLEEFYCEVFVDGKLASISDRVYSIEITYDQNEESYGILEKEYDYQLPGRSIILPHDGLIQMGKHFYKWSDGVGAYDSSSIYVVPDAKVTLTATYEANTTHDCKYETFNNNLVGGVLPAGNYFLFKDTKIYGDITFIGDDPIVICLNGYVLDLDEHSIYFSYSDAKVCDCGHESTTHYYKINNESNYVSSDATNGTAITGGVICNAKNGAVVAKENLDVFCVNFIANENDDIYYPFGGAIYCEKNVNIYGSNFLYNYSTDSGGAVYLNGSGSALLVDCVFKYNHSKKGGAIYVSTENSDTAHSALTLIGTTITNNEASEQGGGIYYSSNAECLAEGTLILMGDGTYKNIEDIKVNDVVKTLNHHTGTLENQKVYCAYEGNSSDKYFTLHFDNGNEISIVGLHDLFEKDTRKYVTITSFNASRYIGKYFYNAITNSYSRLVSVTNSTNKVKYYSIYTEYNGNCIANNMLTVCDDADYSLNIFEFNEDLTINQDKLDEDIEKYGIFKYEDCRYISYDEYLIYQMQYLNIIVGKGLATFEEILGGYYEIGDANEAKALKQRKNRRLAGLLNSFALSTYNTYLPEEDGFYVIIGNGTNITSNTYTDGLNDYDSNLVIPNIVKVKVISNTTNFAVGITMDTVSIGNKLANSGDFGFEMPNSTLASNFTSDKENLIVRYEKDAGKETYTYSINGYKVSYVANTTLYTGELPEDSYHYLDDDVTISTEKLDKFNSTFLGWSDSKTATEPKTTISSINKDYVLYGIWDGVIEEEPSKDNDYEVKVKDSYINDVTYKWYEDLGTYQLSDLDASDFTLEDYESSSEDDIVAKFEEDLSECPNSYIASFYFYNNVPCFIYFDSDATNLNLRDTYTQLISHTDNHYIVYSKTGEFFVYTNEGSYSLENVRFQLLKTLSEETNAKLGNTTLNDSNYFCGIFNNSGELLATSASVKPNTISFEVGSYSSDTIDDMYQLEGRNITMPSNTTPIAGYKSLGWNTNGNATTAMSFTNNKYEVGNSDVTFNAIYEEKKTITINQDTQYFNVETNASDIVFDITGTNIPTSGLTVYYKAQNGIYTTYSENLFESIKISAYYDVKITYTEDDTYKGLELEIQNGIALYVSVIYHDTDATSGSAPKDTNKYIYHELVSDLSVEAKTSNLTRTGYSFDGWYYTSTNNTNNIDQVSYTTNIAPNLRLISNIYNTHVYPNWKLNINDISKANDYEVKSTADLTDCTFKWCVSSTYDISNMEVGSSCQEVQEGTKDYYSSTESLDIYWDIELFFDYSKYYTEGCYARFKTKYHYISTDYDEDGYYYADPYIVEKNNNYFSFYIENMDLDGNADVITDFEIIYNQQITGETNAKVNNLIKGQKAYCVVSYSQTIQGIVINKTVQTNYVEIKQINFDGNNSTSGSIDPLYNLEGRKVTIPTSGYTKTGYKFIGWNTDKNATEALSFTNNKYEVGDSDVTFYAIYEEKEVIELDLSNQRFTYSQNENVPALIDANTTLATTITGFNISYVEKLNNTTVNVTSTINPGQYVATITRDEDDTYKAYSKQIVFFVSYSVTYKANGGVGDDYVDNGKEGSFYGNNDDYVVDGNIKVQTRYATQFTQENYTLMNWNTKADGTGTFYGLETTIEDYLTSNIILYACYSANIEEQATKENDYEIVVETDDDVKYQWYKCVIVEDNTTEYTVGVGSKVNDTISSSNNSIVIIPSFSLAYIQFKTTATLTDGISSIDGYYTYYPIFGRFPMISINSSDNFTITDIKAFASSYVAIENEIESKIKNATENTSYYCIVTSKYNVDNLSFTIYTTPIDFKGNGNNTGKDFTMYQLEGRTVTLPTNPYTKTGYKFIGWNTNKDATTALNSYTTDSSNTTLYAIWEEKEVVSISTVAQTYTYNANNQSFELKGTNKDLSDFVIKYAMHSENHDDNDWNIEAPIDVDSYDVLITRVEDDTYKAYEIEIKNGLVINKYIIKDEDVTLVTDNFTYDGTDQSSSLTATYKDALGNIVSLKLAEYTPRSNPISEASFKDSGTYDVSFILDSDLERINYEFETFEDVLFYTEYTMKQKEIVIDWSNDNYTYNGNTQVIEASYKDVDNQVIELDVSTDEEFKNAGLYTATASFANYETNYKLPTIYTKSYTINKATYNMDNAKWNYTEAFTYDGVAKTIEVTGLPTGVTVNEYTDNTYTNAGSYTAKVTLTYDSANYNDVSIDDIDWTINKATYNMTNAKWNYTEAFTYDGTAKTVEVTGLPTGVTVNQYTDNEFTGAGSYTSKVTLSYDSANYNDVSIDDLSWAINKATYNMTNAKWNYTQAFTYDGTAKTVEVVGLPTGVTVNQYTDNEFTGAGSYTAKVTLTYDSANYNDVSIDDIDWTINKAQASIDTTNVVTTYTYTGSKQTVNSGATLNHSETTLVYSNNEFTNVNTGTYTITISSVETANYLEASTTVDITVNKATYNMDNAKWDYTQAFTYDGEAKTIEVVGLPTGVTVNQYIDNTYTNAGDYTAKVTLTYDSANYNEVSIDDIDWTINKAQASIDTTNVVKTYTYTGSKQTVNSGATLNHSETTLVYSNNEFTNVNTGTYTITISSFETANYLEASTTVDITVNKLAVAEPTISFVESYAHIYDGNNQTVQVVGVEAYMSTNDTYTQKDANTYTITYTLDNNHTWDDNSDGVIEWTIYKAQASILEAMVAGFTYGSEPNIPEITVDFGEVIITYSSDMETFVSNIPTAAGEYYVKVEVESTANYDGFVEYYDLVINKATYDMSNISFDDLSVAYDGNSHSITIKGTLPEGVSVSYENNNKVEAGDYVVIAKFAGDSSNYELIDNKEAKLTIRPLVIKPDNDDDDSTDANVSIDGGFDTNIIVEVVVTIETKIEEAIELNQLSIDYYNIEDEEIKLTSLEKVGVIYDVKLFRVINGVSTAIQPSDIKEGATIIVKMLIPENVDIKKITRILHVHNDGTITSYMFDENLLDENRYYSFEIDKLSEFAFIYKNDCITHWFMFGLIALFITFILICYFALNKKSYSLIIIASQVLFGFGMFILSLFSHCIVCLIAIILAVIALAFSILLFLGKIVKSIVEKEYKLKDSIEKASITDLSFTLSKKLVADYIENKYKENAIVNRRNNYIKSGYLPLADTHFAKFEKKKECFMFVYELKNNKAFILVKAGDNLINDLRKKHSSIVKSAFPDSLTNKWYTVIVDNSFKTKEDLFKLIDKVYDETINHLKTNDKGLSK